MKALIIGASIATLMQTASVSSGTAAASLRCRMWPGARQALDAATAVFAGRVVSTKHVNQPDARVRLWHTMESQLAVDSLWKGVAEPKVTIVTGNEVHESRFVLGDAYLVYAETTTNGSLHSSLCTGTKPLASAGEDIGALGPARALPPPP